MNDSSSNKTYSHDFYTSSFEYNATRKILQIESQNFTEYTPQIHGVLNPVHNGLILFILWIGYKVHRAVVRTLKRLGSRHINTIILASIVSEDSIQCNFRLLALKLNSWTTKAELLQLKPHPFICTRNFNNKKVGNRKN